MVRKVKKRNKIEHDGFVYDPRIIRVVFSDSIVLLLCYNDRLIIPDE